MRILLKQNEEDVLFVNVLRARKYQLNAVVALRLFVVNILINVFFGAFAASKEYHLNKISSRVEQKKDIFQPEIGPKVRKNIV